MSITRPNRAAAVAAVLAAFIVVVMAGATLALGGIGCDGIAHPVDTRAAAVSNTLDLDLVACARLSGHRGPNTASGPTTTPSTPMTTPHSAIALTRSMSRPVASTPSPATPPAPTTGPRH